MPVAIVSKGYIELWKDGAKISSHTVETKAVEAAFAHAETNGDGAYELRFPTKTVTVDMSSIRKRIVPFSWLPMTVTFTQGQASSVPMSSYVTNPQGYSLSYDVSGSLPSGVTLSGGSLVYSGSGGAATSSVTFTATSGNFVATSAASVIAIGSGGSALVQWDAPTTNTSGQSFDNSSADRTLAAYRVYYGTSAAAVSGSTSAYVSVAAPASAYQFTGLAPGTWYFKVTAVDGDGDESTNAATIFKVI